MAGLELLFNSIQNNVKSRGDLIVCCIHWNVVSSGFKCIGVTEEVNAADLHPTELLPPGWNADQNVYTLLYCPSNSPNPQQDLHIVKIVLMDNSLLIHFMRNSTEKVSDITINIHDYTSNDFSSFQRAFKKIEELQQRFKSEVLDNVLNPTRPTTSAESNKETQKDTTQKQQSNPRRDPLRVEPRRPVYPPPDWGAPDDPFSIGRSDIDPFSGGMGGGMVFDPMRGGHRGIPAPGLGGQPLPPGAVPPGARFDPYGPPDIHPSGAYRPNRGARPPDPDMPQPPGYDDMFM